MQEMKHPGERKHTGAIDIQLLRTVLATGCRNYGAFPALETRKNPVVPSIGTVTVFSDIVVTSVQVCDAISVFICTTKGPTPPRHESVRFVPFCVAWVTTNSDVNDNTPNNP